MVLGFFRNILHFVIGKTVEEVTKEEREKLWKEVEFAKELWREIKEVIVNSLVNWDDVIRSLENYFRIKRFYHVCNEIGSVIGIPDLQPPCTTDQVIQAIHWYWGTVYKATESVYPYTHWAKAYKKITDILMKHGKFGKIEIKYLPTEEFLKQIEFNIEKRSELVEELKEFLKKWLTTEEVEIEVYTEAKPAEVKIEKKPEIKPKIKIITKYSEALVNPEECKELAGIATDEIPPDLKRYFEKYQLDPAIQASIIRAYAIWRGLQEILVPGELRMLEPYIRAMASRTGLPFPGTVDTVMLGLKWLVEWQKRVAGLDFVRMRWSGRIEKLNKLFQTCAGIPPPPLVYTHVSKFEELLFEVATEVICSKVPCSLT